MFFSHQTFLLPSSFTNFHIFLHIVTFNNISKIKFDIAQGTFVRQKGNGIVIKI